MAILPFCGRGPPDDIEYRPVEIMYTAPHIGRQVTSGPVIPYYAEEMLECTLFIEVEIGGK